MAAHGGAALQGALAGGGVREALPSIPSAAARDALLQAYRVGFSATLDHLMIIGAVIAFIGSIASFALVRQRDFVPSYAPSPRTRDGTRSHSFPCPCPCHCPGVAMTVVRHGLPVIDDQPAGPRTGRPRDQRASSAITDAALRQLAEVGYAKVSMESVASEAGVARATIYRRYRDKADLITAAIAANSSAHLASGAHDDPRADLIDYLNEFDDRFAESCLEVVGTLIGAREDPGALALHRERVVEPRMGYARSLLERAPRARSVGRRRRPRPGPPDAGRIGVRPAGGRRGLDQPGGPSGPSTSSGRAWARPESAHGRGRLH